MQNNLASLVFDSARRMPDQPALLYQTSDRGSYSSITYSAFARQVNHMAGALEARGVKPGVCVALLLFNDPSFAVCYFALLNLGATVLPLSTRLTTEEIAAILNDAGAQWVISQPDFEAVLRSLAVPSLKGLILDGPMHLPQARCYDYQDLLEEGVGPEMPTPYPIREDNVAVLIYTSGTTGVPKGVMLTHRSLLADATGNAQVIEAASCDRFITISPLFHVFGQVNILLTSILSGATTVLVRKFSPKAVLEAIESQKVTFMAAVPTMYLMMLSHLEDRTPDGKTYDLSSLRVCHSGAAPMAEEVFHRVERGFGAPVQEGYGLSEASSIITSNPLHGVRKPGSVGLPIPGVTLAVMDEAMNELPPGEIGEIHVQGDVVMAGYYRRPEETARALVNGWLKTRDMAFRDVDGYIHIVDRKDDLMNVGGAKVYPREIEEVLFRHPDVQAAAVIGVKSALYHEEIKAFIVPRNGKELNKIEIQKFCREHLAEYKLPKQIEFVNEIPQGATGKILRKTLRQQSADLAGDLI